jgi:general secretion pathway protein A
VYLDFYGLREKPFNTTPDPRFLHLTAGHREALAQLTYGIREQKGFIVLTGEAGTGKTTLLRAVLEQLGDSTATAYVFNSTLSFDGILEYVLDDLGAKRLGDSRAQLLASLNHFLIERRRADQTTVLVLDEAQNFQPAMLEHIRLLSNFETTTQKLLQIVLVGQPELRAKLALRELRQLKQRVALQCRIDPLGSQEVRDYIRTRLRVAGARIPDLFADDAVGHLVEHAGGIPRVVNVLADHCLLIGYADQQRRIDRRIVEQAIAYVDGGAPAPAAPAPTPAKPPVAAQPRRRWWPFGRARVEATR